VRVAYAPATEAGHCGPAVLIAVKIARRATPGALHTPGKARELSELEPVAGNGLLHRRALLMQGAALAGALGAGTGLKTTGAAAEPLVEADWGLAPWLPCCPSIPLLYNCL
jgi:hypothetical protein